MKTVIRFLATLVLGIIYWPFLLKAQDGGAHIDNLEPVDSLGLEQEFMADAVMQSSGSGNTLVIIGVVVIVIAVAAYFILKKNKK